MDGIPGALAPFKGRLLAGIETTVRLYELGKKKLLRKCEHRKCVHLLPQRAVPTQAQALRFEPSDLVPRALALHVQQNGPWLKRPPPSIIAASSPCLAGV